MKIHKLIQGTQEWLDARAKCFTASEAPAMMGCSPYMKRSQLMDQKSTGVAPEVDASTQYLFDNGHKTEAEFRPLAEDIIGDELYPITGSIELDGMTLLASFDGLNMDQTIGFEHKLWSATNVKAIDETGEPPIHHCWQLEHQLLVSGAQKILFATSDGTSDNSRVCEYTSKPERRAALIAGWKQFAEDLAVHKPSAVEAKPVARTMDALPALRIEVTGQVTASNLPQFKETALAAIHGVNRNLKTDQDFADAEQAVKWFTELETKIDAAKAHAQSQAASIDEVFRTLDDIKAASRAARLDLDKQVKVEKDRLRQLIAFEAQSKLNEHNHKLTERVGLRVSMGADFAGVIKGKRSIASIQDAVDTELARAKIAASDVADRMEANAKLLRGDAHDWSFLFPDLQFVADKPVEDFANLLAARIAAHKEAEARRSAQEAAAAERAAQVIQQSASLAKVVDTADIAVGPAVVAKPAEPVLLNATVKLSEINARLAPLHVTAAILNEFGIEPVGKIQNTILYRESDFPKLCRAMVAHLHSLSATA